MNTSVHNPKSMPLPIYIHMLAWAVFFAFPLLMSNTSEGIQWNKYLRHLIVLAMFFVIFYANYWVFVPKYLLKKESSRYLIYNIFLIFAVVSFLHLWYMPYLQDIVWGEHKPEPMHSIPPPRWVFVVKDSIVFIFMAGLGTVIRLSMQWQKAEAARQEAEQNRMEAELNNLRNQLNPHFLLNTLNNIYALIAFDTEKAQQAVQDLSKLLRHVLYENRGTFVPLCKEIDFMRNYIELMRIRLVKGVHLSINIEVSKDSQTPIAPLLFISLIENAFKHGISPTESSFINITISERDGEVECRIVNSNHPKTYLDKSGSGIGLEQVKRRLELLYPGRYKWEMGVNADKTVYTSLLSIQTREMKGM